MNRRTSLIVAGIIAGAAILSLPCCGVGVWLALFQDPAAKGTLQNQVKDKDGIGTTKTPFVLDGIKIELLSGHIGKFVIVHNPPGRTLRTESDMDTLQIRLRVTNSTTNHIIRYNPWHAAFLYPPKLTDEFGNQLKHIESKSDNGHPLHGTGYDKRFDPGQSFDDVIAFDMPLPNASSFTLELPGNALGKPKTAALFKIPRDWFK